MEEHFHPDLLLIGCNTLSVLYDYTEFSEITNFPVLGIVGTGVDLINKKIKEDPNSSVIIFATKTTVKQGQHKKGLLKLGIDEDNIYAEACPKLAGRIERGPDSDTTKSLVNIYVKEAIQKYEDTGEPLYVSYNCTHYGYVDTLFKEAFKANGVEVKEFLDPNPLMADFMFTPEYLNRFKNSQVSVRIVSQPELSPGKLGAIYGLIEPISEETAEALMEYEFTPDYFEWE
jgi:glutamate racemase